MRKRVRRFSSTLAPILLLDTAPSHTNSVVYNACNRNDIRFLFVPAKMTWLLQPLDVAGFAIFKLRLRQFYRREQIRARHGQVATVTWMRLLGTAIITVMQGKQWSSTFDGCGVAPVQTGLRHRILKDIGCDEGVSVPPGEPSLAALGAVFPKRRRLHANQLLRLPREALAREDVASSPSSSPEPPPIHWFGRTRSTAAAPVVVEEADADIVAPSGSSSDAAIASLPPLPAPAWTQGPMTRLRTAVAIALWNSRRFFGARRASDGRRYRYITRRQKRLLDIAP